MYLEGSRWLKIACLVALSTACENTDGTEGSDDGERGNIWLVDANNYRSMSSLSIPTVETGSGTDLDICWSNVIDDIQCHEVAPQADIDNVALLRFLNLTEEEVELKLTSGELAQSEIDGYLEYNTDHASTCTKLSSMSFFGTAIEIEEEYVESSDRTYLLVFTEGTTPGVGARAMTFAKPTAASANTMVEGLPGCGMLDFSADLSSIEAVPVETSGPWVVGWRDVTRDSQGGEIVFENIDGVLLGFYGGMTAAELQGQILDLELIATSLWEIELTGGKIADLAQAESRSDGSKFTGFEGDGTWVLGLMCSACQKPSPIVLAILDPGAGV